MHYEKLLRAFEQIPTAFFENEIEIIDYGCGQLNFMQRNRKIMQHRILNSPFFKFNDNPETTNIKAKRKKRKTKIGEVNKRKRS
ncbi:MAG: hypothetical protein WCH34_14420 [Bacteroidota bacterium]